MANFPLQAWALSDFTGVLNSNRSGTTPDPFVGTSTTLNAAASLVDVAITDEDGDTLFEDAYIETGALSVLTNDVTVGGTTFTAGQNIEVEVALVTDDVPPITFYIARIGTGTSNSGQNEFVFTDAPLVPGQTYNFASGFDGPAVDYSVICFAAGTPIATRNGLVAVEDLQKGDLVFTREAGYQPLAWVGQRYLSAEDLRANPHLAPIRFEAGLPGMLAMDDPLLVSPQHRILHCSSSAELMFGHAEVLVPAKAFVNNSTIRSVIPEDGITYFHIMCEEHQIVQSGGLWTETLLPASGALSAMTPAQRREIFEIFPELAHPATGDQAQPARALLTPGEFKVLAA